MTGSVLEAAYGGVSPTLADARALPREAYTDPAVFEAEVAQVLFAGWAPVARESELKTAGDYRSVDVAGAPLVVTRAASGELHVMSRVCRHRGMLIVEGAGNAKALTCPYHLWRYGLDGKLAAAPAMEQSAVFDRAACSLPRLRSECWGGWVFVNIDGRAPPLAPRLAPLAARLRAVDPAGLVTADVIELDSPWNWKLMVENFLESYHHIGPHAGTLQKTNPGLGTFESCGDDAFTILENPPADADSNAFVVAAAFPLTLMFFSERDAPVGVWYELDAVRQSRFRLRIHLLTSPEFAASPEKVAYLRASVQAVHAEDIAACEAVQAGVVSPFYQPGPLSHLEAPLWRFHAHLARRLVGEARAAPDAGRRSVPDRQTG